MITVRESNGKRIRGYHIGSNEGIKPICRPPAFENDVYRDVEINSFEKTDVCRLLINKIPKPLLELEVFSWRSMAAYRKGLIHNLERIDIEVYNGITAGKLKYVYEKEDKQLKGQMEIEFMEVSP